MSIAFFTPIDFYTLAVGSVSSNVATPGAPAALVVTNEGPNPVAVLAGASSSLAVTPETGLVLLPGQTQAIAGAAYLAAITFGGGEQDSALYIAAGS
jgi:hypothetical protein